MNSMIYQVWLKPTINLSLLRKKSSIVSKFNLKSMKISVSKLCYVTVVKLFLL